ncbi:MAG: electron transfer flavoprotein subunit alpha/FixB family protein [Candidatus Kapaibacterium sp.]
MHILVYLEERNGQIRKPSLEAITAAQALGATTISGCIVGAKASELANASLATLAIATVYTADDAKLANYSSRATAHAVAEIANKAGADVVLIPATGRGKDLAPRVAIRLEAGYVPDVTAFSTESGDITATHPIYAGKANAHVQVTTAKKVYSTRPNLWKASRTESSTAKIENVAISIDDNDLREVLKELLLSQGKLDVAEADIIVSGGRGMKGPEEWPLLENLAAAFGAATGASRAVVDAGWRPHSEQVGQTGKTVSPTLYVALGISGAVQHLAGMSSSKTIVAINKDANAPIFNFVDYGIVGDIFEILPALTEEIKKIKSH